MASPWTTGDAGIHHDSGDVGIGSASTSGRLHIFGGNTVLAGNVIDGGSTIDAAT